MRRLSSDLEGRRLTVRQRIAHIDIETFSDVDLGKCGVYRYAESDCFQILLVAYAFDDGPIQIADLASGDPFPQELLDAFFDPDTICMAHNAQFERVCFSSYLKQQYPGTYLQEGEFLNPDSWYCTMVQAAELGLPFSLDGVATVLKTGEQKDKRGKDLIRYFCVPCRPTKANGGRTRNLPEHDPQKWAEFKAYCMQDVVTERDIHRRMQHFPLSETELAFYHMDQRINDRGWKIDLPFVRQAIACDMLYSEQMTARAYELTGLENPNSVSQLKSWLEERGIRLDSLSKKAVAQAVKELDSGGCDAEVLEMLKLRQKLAKSSVKKYEACERAVCKDGRARGLFLFYGANHTGRFTSRLIQVQNLPQNHLEPLEIARNLVKTGRFDALEYFFGNTPQVLSELIRTAFVPKEGCRFIVADFSAIEARGLSWLAGEEWRMEVFRTHGKIYEATAANMFHIPMETITKTSPERQKGKQAELGCGYGGSVGALISMGALENGLKESELQDIIDAWRQANPKIVQLWYDIDRAAHRAIRTGQPQTVGKICIAYQGGMMLIRLPSGRKLVYIRPRLEPNRFGHMSITYEGIGVGNKWERLETYGAKLVENITQGMCRDILVEAMRRVEQAGFDIVAHVHDEMIVEVPNGVSSVEEICGIMSIPPEWCEDLPLRADGYECRFYRKD